MIKSVDNNIDIIDIKNVIDVNKFYNAFGYEFKDERLLQNALTHSSYCYEHKLNYNENNERLEFLGDALLDTIIAEYLYHRLVDTDEGTLSKLRASIVCEDALLRKVEDIGLAEYIMLGHGEEISGTMRKKRSLVADALEAVIGAVYLDSGWETVKNVVLKLFNDIIEDALKGRLKTDYKTTLQEMLQQHGETNLEYTIEDEQGPDHDKTFFAVLRYKGTVIGKGSGGTKKQAEQNAAKEALEQRRDIPGRELKALEQERAAFEQEKEEIVF